MRVFRSLLKDQVHTARHSCKMAEKNYDAILSKRADAAKLAFHRTPFASSVRELASEQLDEARLERRRRGYSTGGSKRRRSTLSNFTQLVPTDPAFQYPGSPNSNHLFGASTAIMSRDGSLHSPTALDGELSPGLEQEEKTAKSAAGAEGSHAGDGDIELPAPSKAGSKEIGRAHV